MKGDFLIGACKVHIKLQQFVEGIHPNNILTLEPTPPPGKDPDYYTHVLNYMEENGVRAYGCYVIARPQALLKMMDEGVISYISLIDARIGI